MKKHIFNKRGMTYVEMLVALALLALIVGSFTPMLLSSYDALYEAGVKTEGIYKSKEKMEEGLAIRNSTVTANIGMNFYMNAQNMFETMNVSGRKIVANLQENIETVFHGTRARVDLLSSDVVYDDTSSHEIILQTTGLAYKSTDDVKVFKNIGGNLDSIIENLAPGQICVDIIKPDKKQGSENSTTDELVYRIGDRATVTDVRVDLEKERIYLTIGGFDFTHSPLKINIYYVNERGIPKDVTEYLFVKPAHIIMAGDLVGSDYYTSAGVKQVDISTEGNQASHYEFKLEGRGMNVENSAMLDGSDTPANSDTTIKTIAWVDNDTNSYIDSYYVMAGTNGRVYRMYNMKTEKSLKEVLGASNDAKGTTDYPYNIETGETVYPSFWAGEMSDQYSFQTMFKASTYGNAEDNRLDCSAPVSSGDHLTGNAYVGTQYNKIDKHLRYSMLFNSFRTGYTYASQQSRKISYVLAEAGNKSFRVGGKKQNEEDFTGYHIPWENGGDYKYFAGGKISANTTDEEVMYLHSDNGKAWAAKNKHTDMHLAYIRINTYTSINPFDAVKDNTDYGSGETLTHRFVTGGEFWSPPGYSEESYRDLDWKNRENFVNTKYGTSANITSAVYLAGSGSRGQGQVIYFGTVPAYALLRQSSDPTEGNTKVYNTDNAIPSAATIYLVTGTQGNGTTIYRNAYSGENGNKTENVDAQNVMRADINSNDIKTVTDMNAFYTGGNDSVTYKYQANDLEFTLGYCSRWRMAVGDVTFNGSHEETKSYEKYYTKSHDGETATRKPSSINGGGINNLYYNVWFPGEFYNLVETATCDNVTVAVGYTVSGSTFMEQSAYAGGYYGTALGSIYNDGVVAAYVENGAKVTAGLSGKGDQNVIFKNLLYYKSTNFNTSTHARDNVRFEKVGLNAESTSGSTGSSGTKKYYAYYADNKGNVYKSLVATSTVSYNSANDEADETVTLAERINDTSDMQEITVWGYKISQLFSEVTAIECREDVVIITGNPNASGVFGGANGFVVGIKNGDTWTWKVHGLANFYNYNFYCAQIIGAYMYIGGDGWIGAIHVESLKNLPDGQAYPASTTGYNTSLQQNEFVYVPVNGNDKIYAIAGYETT